MIPRANNNANLSNDDNTKEKAEEFNAYFANVGRLAFERSQQNLQNADSEVQISNVFDECRNNLFRPQPVDVDTVILVIKDLNETKSYGSDGISLRFIKDALPVISFYLTVIINTSIVTGLYPDGWKLPHVVHFFQDRRPENYQLMSLLLIMSKMLEKIIANQLTEYPERNNL